MAVWIDYVLLTSYGHETKAHVVQIRLQERVEQLREQLAKEPEKNNAIQIKFKACLKRVSLENCGPLSKSTIRELPIPEYCYYSGKYNSDLGEPSNLAFKLFDGCHWTCIPYRYTSSYMLGSMEGETVIASGGGVEQRARQFPEVSYRLLTYTPQSVLNRVIYWVVYDHRGQ